MDHWQLNERLKFKAYPFQDERSAYTAGYNDAWYGYPKWSSNMRDYYPAAYSDGYAMGLSDRPAALSNSERTDG